MLPGFNLTPSPPKISYTKGLPKEALPVTSLVSSAIAFPVGVSPKKKLYILAKKPVIGEVSADCSASSEISSFSEVSGISAVVGSEEIDSLVSGISLTLSFSKISFLGAVA